MVFTSTIFLFYFLPLVLAAYYLLPRRGRNALLAIASYAFYGWWNPLFVLLLLASTLVDYSCGIRIDRSPAGSRQRKTALVTSVVTNLSILGFFKYYVFAIENINLVLMNLGHDPLASVAILLPVGISFYTFQSMSYTIDLYRGRVQVERSLVDFMAYVSLFPQLVAGPIVRYRDMASQLRDRRESLDAVAKGFCFFAIGFAKKVLIANPLGEVADTVFAASSPAWHVAWFGVTAYAFQIYFDFSGYSDMAIGLGRMFGFSIPQNFNSPYKAKSITDFWRRWHISLSTWLRDYLYVPLGGNRHGTGKTYRNLIVTMLLGGLWHGAAWTFVSWGALHGGLLAFERFLGKRSLYAFLPRVCQTGLTFVLVLLTWVFFRAESIGDAMGYLASMFALAGETTSTLLLSAEIYKPFPLLVFAVAAITVWFGRPTSELLEYSHAEAQRSPLRAAIIGLLFLLGIVEMIFQADNPFLYFQF